MTKVPKPAAGQQGEGRGLGDSPAQQMWQLILKKSGKNGFKVSVESGPSYYPVSVVHVSSCFSPESKSTFLEGSFCTWRRHEWSQIHGRIPEEAATGGC